MRSTCWITVTLLVSLAANARVNVIDERVRSAGCYIADEHGVVVTIGRLNGRLQLPAGSRESGESPPCTARRETLEETGLQVRVGEALEVSNNGRFVLYRCVPETPLDPEAELAPLDFFEVREVMVLNPLTLHDARGVRVDTAWRFPGDRDLLAMLFKRGEPAAPETLKRLQCE